MGGRLLEWFCLEWLDDPVWRAKVMMGIWSYCEISPFLYTVLCLAMSDSLQSHGQRSLAGYSPWDSLGKSTGVGCHALHQGVCPTQGSNPGLLHCRQILYHLNHQGSPILYSTGKKKSFYLNHTQLPSANTQGIGSLDSRIILLSPWESE